MPIPLETLARLAAIHVELAPAIATARADLAAECVGHPPAEVLAQIKEVLAEGMGGQQESEALLAEYVTTRGGTTAPEQVEAALDLWAALVVWQAAMAG